MQQSYAFSCLLSQYPPLPSAARYTLSICADSQCEKLALRKTGIAPGADGVNQYPALFWNFCCSKPRRVLIGFLILMRFDRRFHAIITLLSWQGH
jgi:hypothetical protein